MLSSKFRFNRLWGGLAFLACLFLVGALIVPAADISTNIKKALEIEVFESLVDDITATRAEVVKLVTDLTASRAEVVKLVTDITATRAEVAKLVTDHADYITKFSAAKADLDNLKTNLDNREDIQNVALTWAVLADGSSNKKIKTTADITYRIDGQLYLEAATDDEWSVASQPKPTHFVAYWLYLDSSGAATISAPGTDSASVAAAILALPAITADRAIVGVYVSSDSEDFAAAAACAGTYYTGIPEAYWSAKMAASTITATAPAAATAVAPAAITAVAPAAITATNPAAISTTK